MNTDEKHSTARGNSAIENAGGTPGPKTIFSSVVNRGQFSADHRPSRHFRGAMICPHCGGKLACRDSERLTPLFREVRYQCADIECGASYVASLTIDRMIAPSNKPNPRIKLPIGALNRRAAPAAG